MASCELDYRLSNSSESMEYEETDSDDDNKLHIVESTSPGGGGKAPMAPRTLIRSMSAVETLRDDYQHSGGLASDAVESLLLLGQGPVFSPKMDDIKNGVVKNSRSYANYKHSDQRMMVNYYQKMRERNNEASKRCRLKRRIKQDSLEKTRLLLESQQDVLKKRVAKLHKIKEILNSACRAAGNDGSRCECIKYCNMIKAAHKDMPDNDYSNLQLIHKSRIIRETNLEEIIGAQAPDLNDMKPLKRGPRKVDNDSFTIDTDSLTLMADSPSSASSSSSGAALDLSAASKNGQNKPVSLCMKTTNGAPLNTDNDNVPKLKSNSVSFVTLAPKTPTVIIDNQKPVLPSNLIPVFPGKLEQKPSSTISLNNGTTAILVTPLGGPSTVLNLPISPSSQIFPKDNKVPHIIPMSSKPPPMELLISKAEPEVVIKSEPDFEEIVEQETIADEPASITADKDHSREDIAMDIVETKIEKDPTVSCAAVLSEKEDPLSCSSDLVDLNSLTQTLDLVTMEPRSAGELTSAEKYIIKSRLEIPFWRAEESASFICSSHRASMLKQSNTGSCSICGKKRTKKLDMYIITYRMSVEFYMTNGQFLSIGQLACSSCKVKSLKGLDFSNSYILPEIGHPLYQPSVEIIPIKNEIEDTVPEITISKPREIILHREVVLPSSPTSQGKYVPIQPLPQLQISQSKVNKTVSTTSVISPQHPTSTIRPDLTRARQDLNEALCALNPDYQPLGFTINSLSSCSSGVLQDTVTATKTALSTLLSSIAPGQESSLWRIIKPEMDKLYDVSGISHNT